MLFTRNCPDLCWEKPKMMSNPAAQASLAKRKPISGRVFAFARAALAVALIAVLFYRQSIDLRAFLKLADHPWILVAAAGLILLTLPISSLRWVILLRGLDAHIPFVAVLRIQCIATGSNQLLFGP